MTRARATGIGFTAILMWALLALLAIGSAPVPPLQLSAICFAIASFIGLIWTARNGGFKILKQVPLKVYAFGTIELLVFHLLYFMALREAPTAETNLIAELWPLLVVLGSGLLPGEHIRRHHVIGGLIAFAGAGLIVFDSDPDGANTLRGFALAIGCALSWASYSVLSRFFKGAATEAVMIYCLAACILATGLHFMFEETIWPVEMQGWLMMFALGLGPVGLAFFTWDIGMKKGDIQFLGVASFVGPLLATIILVIMGVSPLTWMLATAAIMITGGALLAARPQ